MEKINEKKLEMDLNYRFAYLCRFMGFGEKDVQAIHQSAAHLAPLVPALVDAVYVKLFQYDATKRHFLPSQHGYEGKLAESLDELTLNHEVIAFRKDHLARYLTALVTKPYDEKFVGYLDFVGKIHTPHAGRQDLNVPLVQMNALLGFVAAALTQVILGLKLEAGQQSTTLGAFTKLLWIQNDLIARHYQAAAKTGIAAA